MRQLLVQHLQCGAQNAELGRLMEEEEEEDEEEEEEEED